MTREMRMKLFKSPLKLSLSLIVAVSLFLGDFVQLESYAAEEDLYIYFTETGFTYSDYAFRHFSSAPSFSSKYGVYDLYSKDGEYIGQKDIYVWVSNIKDETGNPYHFTDRPFVLTSDNKEPSAVTRQASFYNMNYSFSKDLQNVNPIEFNFFPSSTGMSYSTSAPVGTSKNSLTISSPGCTVSSSGGICPVYYNLRSDNWPVIEPGSYLLNFLVGFSSSSGAIPDVLVDRTTSVPVSAAVFNWLGDVVAFNRSSFRHSYNFYLSSFTAGGFPDEFVFIVYYYVTQSVPKFGCLYESNVSASLFSADTNVILDTLQQQKQQTDTLINGYDSTAGDAANGELSSILTGMEDAENKTWLASQESIGSYVFTDILNFSAGLMSGLSLIFSFANSFFLASGDLSVIVSVLYCMAFLAIILGLWRFFRGS